MTLVTGASAGIGEAFARALAERGHDLVVVARDADRLRALAARARSRSRRRHRGPRRRPRRARRRRAVEARLCRRDRPVDLLVNNAGFGTSGPFAELPVDGEEAEIRLNVVALVRLTHAALGPDGRARPRRRDQRVVDRGVPADSGERDLRRDEGVRQQLPVLGTYRSNMSTAACQERGSQYAFGSRCTASGTSWRKRALALRHVMRSTSAGGSQPIWSATSCWVFGQVESACG